MKVSQIVDALEMLSDRHTSYLDKDSGEVHHISDEVLRLVEEEESPESLPGWQREEYEIAKKICESDQFPMLPSKFDVNEWQMMEDFGLSLRNEAAREEVLSAIRGRGAFRNFKDAIRRRRVEDDWRKFRAGALLQIAIDWLESEGVSYIES